MLLLEILHLLVGTVAGLLGGALLLRAYATWLRMPAVNPLRQICTSLTDWMVRPLGHLLPVRGRWDVAALAALLVLASADAVVMRALMGPASGGPASLVPAVLALVLHWGLNLVLLIVLVSALLGLVNPHAPLAPGFDALARPILAPVRRALPRLRGIDLSPLVVLVVLQVLFLVLAPYVP